MMKKRIAWVVVITLVLAFCIGCGNNDAGPAQEPAQEPAQTEAQPEAAPSGGDDDAVAAGPLNITFVSPLLGHPAWLTAKYSSEDAAAELGATLNWVGPAGIDIEEQVRLQEQAIAEGVDGIIICPLEPSAFEDVNMRALEKGILVINTQVDTSEASRTAYIGTDNENFGKAAAEALAEKTGGTANIALLVSSLDSGNQLLSKEAAERIWADTAPGMQIIVMEATAGDSAQAATKVNSLISAYPELDVIWCLDGSAPAGAAQAVNERGMQDSIVILGVDDTDENLDLIVDGSIWGTLAQNYYAIGYESVMMIDKVMGGGSVPSITDSGSMLILGDTVAEYMANR